MPGMYAPGDFDLAGFAVGALERGTALPRDVAPGDVLLGLGSDGIHSNGFSLVRRVAEAAGLAWDAPAPFAAGALGPALLTPTRIYVRPLLQAIGAGHVKGLAHITGGGLTENVPRVLDKKQSPRFDEAALELPPLFEWLRDAGGLSAAEMRRTFNCGVGGVIVCAPGSAGKILAALQSAGEDARVIGDIAEAG